MRGLCKEEDYAFLGRSERTTKETADGAGVSGDNWRGNKEERVRDEEEPVSEYVQNPPLAHLNYRR